MRGSKTSSGGIYIALGSNLPWQDCAPRDTLARALRVIETSGMQVVARSSDWSSPAWPDPADPPYVNAVVEVASELDAPTVMACLHQVELAFDRQRDVRWGSRTLDLDLIDYRGEVRAATDETGLHLPHPRATRRGFVLYPLIEIAPFWIDPVTGRDINALIDDLEPASRNGLEQLQSVSV